MVAIMIIMLGIAVPNLLSQSESIKRTSLNEAAHAVAVAVQSKLYDIKNQGTGTDSVYALLGSDAAVQKTLGEGEDAKTVLVVSNFSYKDDGTEGTPNAELGRKYLLSGAITDLDLMNGKIVVVYDSETANVLEVYYGEEEFSINALFPIVSESHLERNHIGLYRGEGAPAPDRNIGLPSFTAEWVYDDELCLKLQMSSIPDPELYGKPLGLEIFALIPGENGGWDRMMIYAEGIFATDYTTSFVQGDITIQEREKTETDNGMTYYSYKTIKSDATSPLTIEKIRSNDGV